MVSIRANQAFSLIIVTEIPLAEIESVKFHQLRVGFTSVKSCSSKPTNRPDSHEQVRWLLVWLLTFLIRHDNNSNSTSILSRAREGHRDPAIQEGLFGFQIPNYITDYPTSVVSTD
ncbi:hypothetical protein VNO80_06726 [Phaseolus coccineus]|uniref:Uncharacterized protein n=1 Tax=Phaseolus coccineus TaxID=3886 RepID=A0AAN9RIZ1_PHACN